MGSRSTHHLRVKVVRVLCDGCERGAADVYCAHCKASSCKKCKTRLHAGAACKQSFDLTNCAAVLALCHKCRARPAHRYGKNESFSLCQECRSAKKPPQDRPDKDVIKRALTAELAGASRARGHRKSSPRRQRALATPARKGRSSRSVSGSSGDDTTADGEMSVFPFSRESSAD